MGQERKAGMGITNGKCLIKHHVNIKVRLYSMFFVTLLDLSALFYYNN